MKKKKWETPELQIILKSEPEENVLAQCKAVHGPATTVIQSLTGQNCKNAKENTCGACQAEGGGGS